MGVDIEKLASLVGLLFQKLNPEILFKNYKIQRTLYHECFELLFEARCLVFQAIYKMDKSDYLDLVWNILDQTTDTFVRMAFKGDLFVIIDSGVMEADVEKAWNASKPYILTGYGLKENEFVLLPTKQGIDDICCAMQFSELLTRKIKAQAAMRVGALLIQCATDNNTAEILD